MCHKQKHLAEIWYLRNQISVLFMDAVSGRMPLARAESAKIVVIKQLQEGFLINIKSGFLQYLYKKLKLCLNIQEVTIILETCVCVSPYKESLSPST